MPATHYLLVIACSLDVLSSPIARSFVLALCLSLALFPLFLFFVVFWFFLFVVCLFHVFMSFSCHLIWRCCLLLWWPVTNLPSVHLTSHLPIRSLLSLCCVWNAGMLECSILCGSLLFMACAMSDVHTLPPTAYPATLSLFDLSICRSVDLSLDLLSSSVCLSLSLARFCRFSFIRPSLLSVLSSVWTNCKNCRNLTKTQRVLKLLRSVKKRERETREKPNR